MERRADTVDARANRLYLTAAGARKIAVVLPAHDRYVASLLEVLSDSEVAELRTLFGKIEQGLGNR